MKTPFADFRAIKESVSIEQVLAHYGINWLRRSGDELRGRCPIHKGEGERAFHANVVKNIFHCFSGACGAKGNVLDFVAAMERVSIREAAVKLQEWFGIGSTEKGSGGSPKAKVKPAEEAKEPERINPPLTFTLQHIDHAHPYLAGRGISVETAELFGVGYFPGKGSMVSRVVVPIFNERSELVAYGGRALDKSEPKYKLPAGFKKSLVLFNLHRAIKEPKAAAVVVVEGFFDCMRVTQAGYPCVALMGSALSEAQEELLCRHFESCICCFDGDQAGRAATEDFIKRLVRRALR